MKRVVKFPRSHNPARDEALAAFKAGHSQPDCLRPITEWLAVDGWDALIADLDECMALDLGGLASVRFDDDALREGLEIPDTRRVTDRLRVKWARSCIDEAVGESDDESWLVTVLAYALHASDGSSAVVGCIGHDQSQGGIVCDWQGLWTTRDAFVAAMAKARHCWLHSEVDSVPDEVLLGLWEKS